MPLPVGFESITGAQELHDWFGYWPDFHDAESIEFHLALSKPAFLLIHTWQMTKRVDDRGFFDLTKHVLVEFALEGVLTLNLDDPWDRSILLDMVIVKTETGFQLALSSACGLSGTIEAQRISLRIRPASPKLKPPPDKIVTQVTM